jgi:hypothetical protein
MSDNESDYDYEDNCESDYEDSIEINYTIRLAYNKAKELISDCKSWDHASYSDGIDIYEIPLIKTVRSFFHCCDHYLGYGENVKFDICPKNFDLIVNAKVNFKEGFGNYEECFELWENLSEYTRDFQFTINLPESQIEDKDDINKVVFRNKDGKLSIYYIDGKNRVRIDGKEGFIKSKPYLVKEIYCNQGSKKDYSKLLSEEEHKKVFKYLEKLYGITEEKDDEIEILDKLNIK